jgi:hypothetical protein
VRRRSVIVLVLALTSLGGPAAVAQLPTLPGTPTTTTTTTAPPPPPTTAPPTPTTRRPRATTTTTEAADPTATTTTTTTATAAPTTTTTITEQGADEPEFDIETLDAVERDDAIVVRTTVRNLGPEPLDVSADVRVVGDADERVASGRFVMRAVTPGQRKGGSVEITVDPDDAAGVVVTYRAPATTKVARTDLGVATALASSEETDDRRGLLILVAGGLLAALWAVLRARRLGADQAAQEDDAASDS